jgi:hypothetical protein
MIAANSSEMETAARGAAPLREGSKAARASIIAKPRAVAAGFPASCSWPEFDSEIKIVVQTFLPVASLRFDN